MRSQLEIREVHRSFYAPVDRQKFDDNGYPDYSGRTNVASVVVHRLCSWVDAMAGSSSSSSGSSSLGADRSRTNSRSSNRSRPYSRPRSRSPQKQDSYPSHHNIQSAWDQLIHKLQAVPNIIGPSVSSQTQVEFLWNSEFLEEGVILFPENRTQLRLRYWAASNRTVQSMKDVIEFAIMRGMQFLIAIPLSALPRFQLSEPPGMKDLTKRTYDTGFQESQLTYTKGRAAFMDQYLGRLADILRRPHARAVIAMGGPTSWIARHYGGD